MNITWVDRPRRFAAGVACPQCRGQGWGREAVAFQKAKESQQKPTSLREKARKSQGRKPPKAKESQEKPGKAKDFFDLGFLALKRPGTQGRNDAAPAGLASCAASD